jgi:hypothetical protein
MAASYLPVLRFYRLCPLRALSLPLAALLYAWFTLQSAWRWHRGAR